MNSIHNNGENDRSLDTELGELSSTYERIERDKPPELLDQAILNSAHRAVEKKPRWMEFSWLHGLATTAVFVLAFSLILNQPESTPILQDGMGEAESTGLDRAKEAKKQDQDVQSSKVKTKGARQLNMPREAPAAAAPVIMESEPGERARQPSPEVQPSMYLQESRREKRELPNKDAEVSGALHEEIQSDEAVPVVDALKVGAAYEASHRTVIALPGEEEADMQVDAESEIEQELQAILALKKAGDSQWVMELESFRERYPDYPLPDALKEQEP